MAIFGKADRDLPLLTQFYQLEVPSEEAIDKDTDILLRSEMMEWLDIVSGDETPLSSESVKTQYVIMHDIVRIYRLAVPIMNAFADNTALRVGLLMRLCYMIDAIAANETYKHELEISIRLRHSSIDFGNIHEEITNISSSDEQSIEEKIRRMSDLLESFSSGQPALLIGLSKLNVDAEVVPSSIVSHGYHNEPIKKLLTEDLYSVVLKKKRLARCVECNSPFVVKREGHIFCSKRCTDRVARRAYRIRGKDKNF